jgi:hypothetical protein
MSRVIKINFVATGMLQICMDKVLIHAKNRHTLVSRFRHPGTGFYLPRQMSFSAARTTRKPNKERFL